MAQEKSLSTLLRKKSNLNTWKKHHAFNPESTADLVEGVQPLIPRPYFSSQETRGDSYRTWRPAKLPLDQSEREQGRVGWGLGGRLPQGLRKMEKRNKMEGAAERAFGKREGLGKHRSVLRGSPRMQSMDGRNQWHPRGTTVRAMDEPQVQAGMEKGPALTLGPSLPRPHCRRPSSAHHLQGRAVPRNTDHRRTTWGTGENHTGTVFSALPRYKRQIKSRHLKCTWWPDVCIRCGGASTHSLLNWLYPSHLISPPFSW